MTRTLEWINTTATHEVTVELIEKLGFAYYLLGVNCINENRMHVRATSISRHDERQQAIRHAERLIEIINWAR
jgi:hypothetical protein